MRNIRYLSKAQPKKRTTEYAVFFEHDGAHARLDWELSDDTDETVTPEFVAELMLKQLEFDLNDEAIMDRIRNLNKADTVGSRVKMYLENGYVEHEAPEFKAKAVEMFGDS